MSQNISAIQPLYLFITGGSGVGKSFLFKILYQSLRKTFSYRNSSLDTSNFFLTTTGVENIDGATILFALDYPGLSDKMKSNLRNKYSEIKVLVKFLWFLMICYLTFI